MKSFGVASILALLLLSSVRASSFGSRGRKLLAQNLPANQAASTAALNATGTGRQALALYGSPNATLARFVSYALLAHAAAEETFTTSAAGQASATVGSTAATGASLLAITAVLANDTGASAEAQRALGAADSYVRAIQDENPLPVSNATFANLVLLANIGHDGTLTQYWQNASAGIVQDNETFTYTVESVPTLVETAQTQLGNGGSPALALMAMEMAVRNILGAVYVYNGNTTAAYREGVAESRLILKAVNTYQRGSACQANVTAAVSAVTSAVEAANTAAASPSPTSVQAAGAAANAAIPATSCSALSPALAPAPITQGTASGGR